MVHDFLDTIKMDYMENWTCDNCNSTNTIKDFCQTCENDKKNKEMIEIQKRIALATIEPYFKAKYGTTFGINDIIVENDEEKRVRAILVEYLHDIKDNKAKEKGMVLFGGQGTGKSMYSNIIQFEMNKRFKTTVRTTQYLLYQEVLEDGARTVLTKYISPDFLFLDEVGRMNKTDNAYHTFFNLINERYSKNKQTIITTNLMEGIGEYLDKDRLKEFKAAKFTWKSRRGL